MIYISANELKKLIPEMSIGECRIIINQVREDMKQKGYYVPNGKTKLALRKLVNEKLGI